MYIEKEKWENLKEIIDYFWWEEDRISSDGRYYLNKLDNLLSDIDKNKSDKVYVITNNAIFDDEIDYSIRGVAFTKKEAEKLFEEAIRDAKIDADFENLDAIDVSDGIEFPDEKWHYTKSEDSFELYLEGEYNSNNFSIQIKEYEIEPKKILENEEEYDL